MGKTALRILKAKEKGQGSLSFHRIDGGAYSWRNMVDNLKEHCGLVASACGLEFRWPDGERSLGKGGRIEGSMVAITRLLGAYLADEDMALAIERGTLVIENHALPDEALKLAEAWGRKWHAAEERRAKQEAKKEGDDVVADLKNGIAKLAEELGGNQEGGSDAK